MATESYLETDVRGWLAIVRSAHTVHHEFPDGDLLKIYVVAKDERGEELGHALFEIEEIMTPVHYFQRRT